MTSLQTAKCNEPEVKTVTAEKPIEETTNSTPNVSEEKEEKKTHGVTQNSRWCDECACCYFPTCDVYGCDGNYDDTLVFCFEKKQRKVACSTKCAKIIALDGTWTKVRSIYSLIDSICECKNKQIMEIAPCKHDKVRKGNACFFCGASCYKNYISIDDVISCSDIKCRKFLSFMYGYMVGDDPEDYVDPEKGEYQIHEGYWTYYHKVLLIRYIVKSANLC